MYYVMYVYYAYLAIYITENEEKVKVKHSNSTVQYSISFPPAHRSRFALCCVWET